MWNTTASIDNLKKRAELIKKIRQYFADINILEVDTPLLSHSTVTDPKLASFQSFFYPQGQTTKGIPLYLQTSPEYAMKRLLVAGSGSIYQLCKAFRNGEAGRLHNPEFTLLEWYHVGFDYVALMTEVDQLLQAVLHLAPANYCSYRDLFYNHYGIDPHVVSVETLKQIATHHAIQLASDSDFDKNDWLDLLMSHQIEPQLGKTRPTFVYDYPASQAALASMRAENDYQVAERFEVYIQGIEIANGFNELTDAKEQRERFLQNQAKRRELGLAEIPLDEHFLAALTHGMPACAGVALGVDRLVMLALKANHIHEVIAFPWERA